MCCAILLVSVTFGKKKPQTNKKTKTKNQTQTKDTHKKTWLQLKVILTKMFSLRYWVLMIQVL